MKTITEKWFGEHFVDLHPSLQKLHSQGGVLSGDVHVIYGTGIASFIGKRLGKKLGLPGKSGQTNLRVEITHTDNAMIWSRQFGDSSKPMTSIFTPIGNYKDGYWSETTGALSIDLQVEVNNGEWCWIQRATRLKGFTVPAIVLPELTAGKYVKDGFYHFNVTLFKRGIGLLVQYEGRLTLDTN